MSEKFHAKRLLRNLLIATLTVIVTLVIVLQFFLGSIIKKSAETFAPMALGVPVTIESAKMRVFSGECRFTGVVIGPPEGFKANVFELADFDVKLDVKSLFTDTVVIKEIIIKDPKVAYELSGIHSNIKAIENKIGSANEKEKAKDAEKEKTGGKKFVVEKFSFTGGRVKIASATLGIAAPLPLPGIELHDVGKKTGGITALELTGQIFGSIFKGIGGVVVGIGGLAVDGVTAVGGLAVDGVKAVGDAIGGLFGGGKTDEADDKTDADKK